MAMVNAALDVVDARLRAGLIRPVQRERTELARVTVPAGHMCSGHRGPIAGDCFMESGANCEDREDSAGPL